MTIPAEMRWVDRFYFILGRTLADSSRENPLQTSLNKKRLFCLMSLKNSSGTVWIQSIRVPLALLLFLLLLISLPPYIPPIFQFCLSFTRSFPQMTEIVPANFSSLGGQHLRNETSLPYHSKKKAPG